MIRPLYLSLALLAGAWSGAAAQDSTAVQDRREAAIQTLDAGQRIRIATTPDERLQGVYAGVEGGELLLDREGATARIVLEDIERLWRRGRATKRGAALGGAIGAVVGAATGVFIGEVICDGPDCQADTAVAAVTLGLGGGAVGALAGALVGLAIPRWHQLFP